ncbi:hypothetical protein CCYA_CCYA04G1433 [Cyanidiococcus yangmingshanensis]|nr:hypothetical protein CCYA_CCYA04G1433 [Cyanidiococcus yangmingshanensis]
MHPVSCVERREYLAKDVLSASVRQNLYRRVCSERDRWQWRSIPLPRDDSMFVARRYDRPTRRNGSLLRAVEVHPSGTCTALCSAESIHLTCLSSMLHEERWTAKLCIPPLSGSNVQGERPASGRSRMAVSNPSIAIREKWRGIQWMPFRGDCKLLAWTNHAFGLYSIDHSALDTLQYTPSRDTQALPICWYAFPTESQSFLHAASWLSASKTPPVFHHWLVLACGSIRGEPFAGLFDPRERPILRGCGRFQLYRGLNANALTPVDIWSVQNSLAPTLVGVVMPTGLQFHDLRMLGTGVSSSSAHSFQGHARLDWEHRVPSNRAQSISASTATANGSHAVSSASQMTWAGVEARPKPSWCRPASPKAATLTAQLAPTAMFSTIRPLPEEAQHPGHLSVAITAAAYRRCAVLDIDWNALSNVTDGNERTIAPNQTVVRWCYSPEVEQSPFRHLVADDARQNEAFQPPVNALGSSGSLQADPAAVLGANHPDPSRASSLDRRSTSRPNSHERTRAEIAFTEDSSSLMMMRPPLRALVSREYRFSASDYLQSNDNLRERVPNWQLSSSIQPAIRYNETDGKVLLASPVVDADAQVHLCLFDLSPSGALRLGTEDGSTGAPLLASWNLDDIAGPATRKRVLSCLALGAVTPVPSLFVGYADLVSSPCPNLRMGSI